MTKKAKKSKKKTKASKKSASKTQESGSSEVLDSLQESSDTIESRQSGCQLAGGYFWPIMSIVLAIALVGVLVVSPGFGEVGDGSPEKGEDKKSDVKFQDEFIFVESVTCDQACEEMEPIAREAAELAGLEFRKIGLDEQIPVPGYMVIKDEKAKTLLEAIQEKEQFYRQMCIVTGVEELCQKSETQEEVSDGPIEMAELNECLAENGMTIYGMEWCGHCTNLVESLGGYEAAQPVYVECTEEENQQRCSEERQSSGVPEIQIDGELYRGERSPERLAEAVGCNF